MPDSDKMPKWAQTMKEEIVNSLKSELSSMVSTMIEKLEEKLTTTSDESEALRQQVASQELQIAYLKNQHNHTMDRLLKMESYSMRENLIISGVRESENETEQQIREKIQKLFRDDLKLDVTIPILRCHRLGPNKTSAGPGRKHRDIIIRLTTHSDKKTILRARKNLAKKRPPIYINEQYPREIEQIRHRLRPFAKQARELKLKATVIQDRLLVDGKLFSEDMLDRLPFDITPVSTTITDTKVLFSGRTSLYSSFHMQPFIIDNVEYACPEQYYQCSKAKHADDQSAATAIMMETDPAKMKSTGDGLQTNLQDWDSSAPKVMHRAILAKFDQNPALAAAMTTTGQKSFVYCNPHDIIWSAGLSLRDKQAADPKHWKGNNQLGKILDSVRDELSETEWNGDYLTLKIIRKPRASFWDFDS